MGYKIIVDGIQHKFSSAHFIAGHDKCGRIHGHNFHVRVEIAGPLDDRCFVVDFIDVKKALAAEIEKVDHKLLVPGTSNDIKLTDAGENMDIVFSKKRYSIPKADIVILPLPAITSEVLAKYFHDALASAFKGCKITVRIGETSSSFAEYGE